MTTEYEQEQIRFDIETDIRAAELVRTGRASGWNAIRVARQQLMWERRNWRLVRKGATT